MITKERREQLRVGALRKETWITAHRGQIDGELLLLLDDLDVLEVRMAALKEFAETFLAPGADHLGHENHDAGCDENCTKTLFVCSTHRPDIEEEYCDKREDGCLRCAATTALGKIP